MTDAPTLNLSKESVSIAWKARGVASLVSAMKRCEHWAVDSHPDYMKQAEVLIDEVCRVLNATNIETITANVEKNPVVLIDFMGHIKSGRALSMFSWLTDMNPHITQLLISEARFGNHEFGSILIERITTLERQFLLSRVFSPERIALVLELVDDAQFLPA